MADNIFVPKLGDYLFWEGQLAKIIWVSDRPMVGIELLRDATCPHCGKIISKDQISVIPTSPHFQEKARPLPTITNGPPYHYE